MGIVGRGINIKGVDLVIFYTLPKTLKQYIWCLGHVGRLGHPSISLDSIPTLGLSLLQPSPNIQTRARPCFPLFICSFYIHSDFKKIEMLHYDIFAMFWF